MDSKIKVNEIKNNLSLERVIPLWREGKVDFESGGHGELFLFISALQATVAKIFFPL